MACKLSDDAVIVIKTIQSDSKNTGKITSNKEMEEFCLGVSLLLMGVKASDKDKAFYKQVIAFLEEIQSHINDIDYEDLNSRL